MAQRTRFIENAIVRVAVVGTDPMQLSSPQFQTIPTAKSGPLSKHPDQPYTGPRSFRCALYSTQQTQGDRRW